MSTLSIKRIALDGGCFWCTEAVFKMLKGIVSVRSGYAGGHTEDPTYEEVSSGTTGHAEVIYLEYEPDQISLRDILTVFFASHDGSSLNRQGNDVGTQYRSIVLYETDEQKQETKKFINELNASNKNGKAIVTKVVPLDRFYEAELYHQNYYENNQSAPYCEIIINPKLEKVQKEYANLLKENYEQQKS